MKHQLTTPDLLRNRVLKFNESLLRGKEAGLIISDEKGHAIISIAELTKRKEDNSSLRIGTHGDDYPGPGHHHADEILSAALIRVLLNVPITVVCTRDERILDTCDLVIDVGEGLLDHHGARHEDYISSCVKVFMLCKQTLMSGQIHVFEEKEHPEFYPIADICCRVAAQDTGHEIIGNDPFPWFQTIVYYARGCYKHGVQYTDEQLVGHLLTSMCDELAAIIYNEIWRHESFEVTYSKIKDQKGKPYMVFDEDDQESDIKQMIWRAKSHETYYFITKEMNGTYRVCCCAKNSPQYNRFSTKHAIPVCFRGLTKLELDEAAGLNHGDSIFCHKQGFVAGFNSLDAALRFCEVILSQKGDQENG